MQVHPEFVQSKTVSYRGRNYTIKNLEKEYLPHSDCENRMYRSAVYNQHNSLVALAPLQSFPRTHNAFTNSSLLINEIIEGTMINLFWDSDENCWDICTKKSIGGNYCYFKTSSPKKTFRSMFLEALLGDEVAKSLADVDFSTFDKSCCYNFVLQHPENHIVIPVAVPRLYLVSAFAIDAKSGTFKFIPPKQVNTGSLMVSIPDEYRAETLVQETLVSLDHAMSSPTNSYLLVGYMVTDVDTGYRTAYYNKRYLEVKILRGNNPSLHYQYLVLRKIGKVSEFLHYFPMYHEQFSRFFEHFKMFCERIHKLYWQVYVKKETPDGELCSRDKFFINKLQFEYFIPGKKANPKYFITKKVVAQMMDTQNVMVPF
jgi:hypothetical protein